MSAVRLVTLTTSTTLPQARVLAASLRRHNPELRLDVVLIAREGPGDSSFAPVPLDLAAAGLDVDVEALIACHDERDLVPLVLPRLLEAYSKQLGEPVLHLPPTVWVTGDLRPVVGILMEHSVMLTQRTTRDPPNDGLGPSVAELERVGRISDTIMGVDGSPEAYGFLQWWGAHLEQMLGSLDGAEARGRPEDRPWLSRLLELAPARFRTAVLDDPGCNASMWNLDGRRLEASREGVVLDGLWPLRFMDLAGFEPDFPYRLSAVASRVRVSRSAVLRELCSTYASELAQAGWRSAEEHHEVGRTMANGLVFDEVLASLHARAIALGEHFDDLFGEQGSQAFVAWLTGPALRGAVHGITRYVFYRVLRERPDVMRAYPDLDGPDGIEYVAWCEAFGRRELAIPERFMPSLPASRPPTSSDAAASEGVASEGAVSEGAASEGAVPNGVVRAGRGADTSSGVSDRASGRPEHGASPAASTLGDPRPPAVRVSGYLGHALGLGSAARGYAHALSAAGVPTSTVTVALDHMEMPVELGDSYGRHDFDDLVHEGSHGFELVAVNPDELPAFVERVGEGYFHGPRIGIWGWETNSIPARWGPAFGLVDEIWVYSRFMAENIGAATSLPVIALPPPVQPPAAPSEPLRLGVPDGFMFLFMFDYLSTIQRKNPVGLIEAFKQAFAPGEGPQLLVKTINGPLRPLAEEALLWAAHGRPDVHVVDCSLSAAERDSLVAGCDCYVSLHRSEGFGLTLAEAMALGKSAIGTGYSGNVDFMNSENSYLVDYEITRVGPGCEIYPADGEWAEPSVEHAAELMRCVVERPDEAAIIGARAREDIARTLSLQATGGAMRRRLEEVGQQ
jgi:glycosyltransferase involved in cell wall biosynthesis